MTSSTTIIDKIYAAKAEIEKKQGCFDTISGGSSAIYPPHFPPLPKPSKEELLPDQEEMDKLASKLTEAVLQLRAGDMKGARATLSDADGLCGVTLYGRNILTVPDHHMDALRYGMGMSKQYMAGQTPERPRTATEQLMKQQIAERVMREMMDSVSSTLYPPHILSDNTADPTDSGV